jgi:hypothetical protein
MRDKHTVEQLLGHMHRLGRRNYRLHDLNMVLFIADKLDMPRDLLEYVARLPWCETSWPEVTRRVEFWLMGQKWMPYEFITPSNVGAPH